MSDADFVLVDREEASEKLALAELSKQGCQGLTLIESPKGAGQLLQQASVGACEKVSLLLRQIKLSE